MAERTGCLGFFSLWPQVSSCVSSRFLWGLNRYCTSSVFFFFFFSSVFPAHSQGPGYLLIARDLLNWPVPCSVEGCRVQHSQPVSRGQHSKFPGIIAPSRGPLYLHTQSAPKARFSLRRVRSRLPAVWYLLYIPPESTGCDCTSVAAQTGLQATLARVTQRQ